MKKQKSRLDLDKKVMKQIHSQHIAMRPRIFFVIGSILLGAGLAVFLFTAVFFVGLTLFRLRVHGPWGFLVFGQLGIKPFLNIFPWIPLVLGALGIFGGIKLIKKYDFSYKKSFISIVLILLVFIITLGFIVDQLGIHERLEKFSPLHTEFLGQNWVSGLVLGANENKLDVVTPHGDKTEIVWDDQTLLPTDKTFQTGDKVRAIGEWVDEDTFSASGIGKGSMYWRKDFVQSPKPIPGKLPRKWIRRMKR